MLDYGFQEGEEVIDIYGRKGEIVSVCKCCECKARGFYEPIVKWEHEEDKEWITNCQEAQGFPYLHSIGKRVFNPYDREETEKRIDELQKELSIYQKGLKVINKGE